MKNVSYRIRKLRQKEIHILDDFLYEAIFIPEGTKAPPKEIIKEPELQVYVADFWEKKDDICYVAEISGKIAGAVLSLIHICCGNHSGRRTESKSVIYNHLRRR